MRNVFLALVTLALGATAAPAQSWAEKLFPGGTSHDFGTVPRGAQLFHRFEIKNIYAVPLDIVHLQSSCGCATVAASVKTIPPNGTAHIDLTMDARRFVGPKTIKITLTVGPNFVSTAELKASANSRTDVVLNPGQLSFGVVARGEQPTQTIDVEYAGVLDWRVTQLDLNNAPVTASVHELYRRPGQVGYQVKVALKPDAPAGLLKQELFLRTNDPASKTVPILLEATIQPPLTVSPDAITGLTLRAGGEEARRVVLRGNKPFRILKVDGGEGLSVVNALPSPPAAVQVLTFKVQAAKPGEFKRQLQVLTDLQDTALTVRVEGTAVP